MFVFKGVLQSESLILINSNIFHVQRSFNPKYSDFSLLLAWWAHSQPDLAGTVSGAKNYLK